MNSRSELLACGKVFLCFRFSLSLIATEELPGPRAQDPLRFLIYLSRIISFCLENHSFLSKGVV